MPAGTKHVVVHSGTGKADLDNRGTYHVYVDGEHGKGNWVLNNGGDRIQLVSPDGKIVADETFPANHCGKVTKPKPNPKPVVIPPPPAVFGEVEY